MRGLERLAAAIFKRQNSKRFGLPSVGRLHGLLEAVQKNQEPILVHVAWLHTRRTCFRTNLGKVDDAGRLGMDGTLVCHRDSSRRMAMSSMRKDVFEEVVVQQGIFRQEMCSLWTAEIRIASLRSMNGLVNGVIPPSLTSSSNPSRHLERKFPIKPMRVFVAKAQEFFGGKFLTCR
jgi:hypothetical protein